MAYAILFTSRGRRSFGRLDRTLQERAKARIKGLADDPRPAQSEALTTQDDLRSLRINRNYRIFYAVDDENRTVTIDLVGPHDYYRRI